VKKQGDVIINIDSINPQRGSSWKNHRNYLGPLELDKEGLTAKITM
jgi:hypothetical protein